MRIVCWCGSSEVEHPIGSAHHFDNTETTWQAYCEMYRVAKKDYDNQYSFWNALKEWWRI